MKGCSCEYCAHQCSLGKIQRPPSRNSPRSPPEARKRARALRCTSGGRTRPPCNCLAPDACCKPWPARPLHEWVTEGSTVWLELVQKVYFLEHWGNVNMMDGAPLQQWQGLLPVVRAQAGSNGVTCPSFMHHCQQQRRVPQPAMPILNLMTTLSSMPAHVQANLAPPGRLIRLTRTTH